MGNLGDVPCGGYTHPSILGAVETAQRLPDSLFLTDVGYPGANLQSGNAGCRVSASTAQLPWRLASAISTKFIRNFLLGQIHSDFELLRKQLLGLCKWRALDVRWDVRRQETMGAEQRGLPPAPGPVGLG